MPVDGNILGWEEVNLGFYEQIATKKKQNYLFANSIFDPYELHEGKKYIEENGKKKIYILCEIYLLNYIKNCLENLQYIILEDICKLYNGNSNYLGI